MKPCKCQTVKRYEDKYRCMLCYREFVPKERQLAPLEAMLRKDYATQGQTDESEVKPIRSVQGDFRQSEDTAA